MFDEMKAKFFDRIRKSVNDKGHMLSEVIDEVVDSVQEYEKWESSQPAVDAAKEAG